MGDTSLLCIRTDAGPDTGTGHLMRCLALAQAWREAGGEVLFVGRVTPPGLRERLRVEGFSLRQPPAVHPDPADMAALQELLRAERPAWCVLDGYHFDGSCQEAVRRTGTRLLVVDDMGLLPRYYADLVLNQNLHGSEMDYPLAPGSRALLGARYVLLRAEFRAAARREEDRPWPVRRLLVSMGGADAEGAALLVLRALARVGTPSAETLVLAGPANPRREELRALAAQLGSGVRILDASDDMPGLMAWADAAVSAAGSTCWELLYSGVPFAMVVLADNQRGVADRLDRGGVALSLGEMDGLAPEELAGRLAGFLGQGDLLRARARAGRRLVDGNGPARVVRAMREVP